MPWVKCDVKQAGPAENGVIYIALRATNGSFYNWFIAVPAMQNQMLATALGAMSLANPCWAFLTNTTPYSTVNRLYAAA